MKKPVVGLSGATEKPLSSSDWSMQYPTLWEHLTCTAYDSGEPRLTSSLSIFTQDGVLKACVNDKDLDRSAFFTGETMELLLESIERGLINDDCDWRRKPGTKIPSSKIPF